MHRVHGLAMAAATKIRGVSTLLCLAAWLCTAGAASGANQRLLSDCLSSVSETGRQACEDYAYTHRHQVQKLLNAAERLIRQQRYESAIALFDTGLRFNRDNSQLMRARLMTKSEWDEARFLGLRHQASTGQARSAVKHELDRIMCTSLSGEDALSACRRLLSNKQPLPGIGTETAAPAPRDLVKQLSLIHI